MFSSGSIPTGEDFALLIDSVEGPRGEDGRDFTFEDFTLEQLAMLKGEPGYIPQKDVDYFDGKNGRNGTDGKSAYQIAVDGGFTGTESEWLISLEGKRGPQGDSGLIHAQSNNQLRLWDGDVTVGKDGKWTVNYADASFTTVIAVIPTFSAKAHDSDPSNMAIGGGVINSTITNTSTQGYAVRGFSAGLLAAMTITWAQEGTLIHVTVIGH